MKTIEIDEELFSYLQKRAEVYVETPNDTIKRLLEITNVKKHAPEQSLATEKHFVPEKPHAIHSNQSPNLPKQAKVNLPLLLRDGIIKKGQPVIFQDYRGTQYQKYHVVIDDSGLLWEDKRYSMSELARQFLQELNHNSQFVRGPIFWVTEDGKTIAELWREYLNKKS